MHNEYETISCVEFRQLLTNIKEDTPLGKIVQIRSEKNPEILKKMSNNEREIRTKWFEFRSKNAKRELIEVNKENIDEVLSKFFK